MSPSDRGSMLVCVWSLGESSRVCVSSSHMYKINLHEIKSCEINPRVCVCVCVYMWGEARVVCANVQCGEFHSRYHLHSRYIYLGEFVQLSVFYLLLACNSCTILFTVNPDLCRAFSRTV